MRKTLLVLAAMAVLSAACQSPGPVSGTGGGTGGGSGGGTTTGGLVNVTGTITGNVTWTKENTYVLKELIYVDNGGVLTIQPGTKVVGDKGSALVVTRGSQLVAEGTATEPIVFSSNFPVGTRGVGSNNWGGILMLGSAAINVTGGDNNAEGVADEPRNRYGGGATPNNASSCGKLKYVRIEFAGQPLSANNELNGLTLCGCGSGTLVDYVQVHNGIDDGVEVFGGSVDLRHLVITGSDDDGLDWDQGWTGRAQFLVVQQHPGRGNHGFEADSNRAGQDNTPRSKPTIFNATLIGRAPDASDSGEGRSRGLVLRVGTAGSLNNLIVTNFNDWGFWVDGTTSQGQWNSGALAIKNSIFWKNPSANWQNVAPAAQADGGATADNFDEESAITAPSLANRGVDPLLADAMNVTAPSFKLGAGSPALTGGATPPADDGFFDTTATFVGAVGPTDWTAGWTAFPEN